MGVSVDHREIWLRTNAGAKTRRRVEKPLIKIAPIAREAVAQAIDEAPEMLGTHLKLLLHRIVGGPRPDGDAKARMVPPFSMEARQGTQDLFALRHRRRQRPCGGNDVRFGEVFE